MYETHFQLRQEPFSIAPDPSFLYLSEGHREALAHLRYGFNHGGFVLITGEVGTGKTTLLRNLIRQTPKRLDVAFILNPRLTVRELLETICDELRIEYDPNAAQSIKQYIDVLTKHLLKAHRANRSTVLIIDEAQNLSPAVLEQIRLLTNLETDERKLLRIILIGQPELGAMLDRVELRQLAQRITARYHLEPLTRDECYAYLIHRITRAGGSSRIFKRSAMATLFKLSKGIPRLLNVLADRSLLGAYVENLQQITPTIVRHAAREVLGEPPKGKLWLIAGISMLSIAGVAMALLLHENPETVPKDRLAPDSSVADTLAMPERATNSAYPVQANEINPRAITKRSPQSPELSAAQPLIQRPSGTAYQTQQQAFAALFDSWDVDYRNLASNTRPCDFAPTVDLQCLGRKGTWHDILALDLPLALELWTDEPDPFYAAVIKADADRLDIILGNQRQILSPTDLRDLWFGSYVVLWRTPPNYSGNLGIGDRHPNIGWLRRQLEPLVSQRLDSPDPDQFDRRLEKAVRIFQKSRGLVIDGIVGPETWIHLGAALGLDTPTLSNKQQNLTMESG